MAIIVAVVAILCIIAVFFIWFERKRPGARELALVAVMCALAVASRAAFIGVPHVKPMAAVIMIAGVAFGAPTGFLVGALSALASNFIFGQGPWTPWQMLSFGLCGLVFGMLSDKGIIPKARLSWAQRIAFALGGGVFIILIAGPVLDTSSLLYMVSKITPESVFAVYAAGFPVNCLHGIATCIVLLIAANPILGMLDRVRVKYGVLE